MEPLECELRREMLILEEQVQYWLPWHCYKWDCKHHMCKVRRKKLSTLDSKLYKVHQHLRLIESQKRMATFLRVESSP
jgi:hypothetical protein